MNIPEHVGSDGIETHGPRHTDTIAPVRSRDSRVMNLAREHLEGFAIEFEPLTCNLEAVSVGALRHTNREDQSQQPKN